MRRTRVSNQELFHSNEKNNQDHHHHDHPTQRAYQSSRGIQSWQNLIPKPNITLLGFETGYDIIAAKYGLNIRPNVDKTFLGVPLFNSIFQVANQSKARIAMIINGDIVLLQDFMDTIRRAIRRFEDFLVISARDDLQELPTYLQGEDLDFYQKIGEYAREYGTLHTYGRMDLWAWNIGGPRLFSSKMPHFIFGRGKYNITGSLI